MRVQELLEVISEGDNVEILDSLTGEVLSVYNGKDSISVKYNDCEVRSINTYNGSLAVWIQNDMPVEYVLTETGLDNVQQYIKELMAKRKEILDAGKDTIEETTLPTEDDILSDVNDLGVDEDGEYYNGWAVTDNYDADYPLLLKIGRDLRIK